MSAILDYEKYTKNNNTPQQIVIMLHGYGANKNDLISLAPDLASLLPSAIFIAPSAPFPFEGMIDGASRQWFSLFDRSDSKLIIEMSKVEKYIVPFISQQLNKYNLSEDSLCLLGFSQGTMLSLYLIMQSLVKPKLFIGYSGKIARNNWRCSNKKQKTKVMLIHGKEDNIITTADMLLSVRELKRYGFSTNYFISNHLAHGIDKEGVHLAARFLKSNFIYTP